MRPKLAAAIITGTMARPSRPSVRFTALPAPTMTNAGERHEEPAEIEEEVLEEREGAATSTAAPAPICAMKKQAIAGDDEFERSRALPEKPLSSAW